MSKIFNPLYDTLEDSIVSTSSLTNDVIGVCPKCRQSFGSGTISNGDTVFYCETCRVSQPTPTQ